MTLDMKESGIELMALQICQQMGWGGQPIKSAGHFDGGDGDVSERLNPVTTVPRLRITFNSNVSSILPWKFTPQQREVRVLPGETALAFYTATNNSNEDIIGVATYSVSPGQVAPYFSKIQCFCFEEQRLNAGETVDMPVFFYIDPEFVNDPNMKGIETVTLSYTFFSELNFLFLAMRRILMSYCRGKVRQEWPFEPGSYAWIRIK